MRKKALDILWACKAHPFFLVFAIDNLHHSASAIGACIALLLVAKINMPRRQNFTRRIIRQITKENRLVLGHDLVMDKSGTHFIIAVCKGHNYCFRFLIVSADLHKLHFTVAHMSRRFRTEQDHICFVILQECLDIADIASLKHLLLIRIIDPFIYKTQIGINIFNAVLLHYFVIRS